VIALLRITLEDGQAYDFRREVGIKVALGNPARIWFS
jgi:hypothetical protein